MLKQSIIISLAISCITTIGYAIDLDIPGADSKIPDTAYQTFYYVTPKMKAEDAAEVDRIVNRFKRDGIFERVKKERKLSTDEDVEVTIRKDFEQNLDVTIGQTEVVEHYESNGIHMTVPFSSLVKVEKPNHTYTLVGVTGDTTIKINYGDNGEDAYPFKYKQFNNLGLWAAPLIKPNSNTAGFLLGLTVPLDDTSNVSYDIVVNPVREDSPRPTDAIAAELLINYVLPSIKVLDQANTISHYDKYKNIQYRVLNGTERKLSQLKDPIYGSKSEVVNYSDIHGVEQSISLVPLHDKKKHFLLGDNPNDPYNFRTHLNYLEGLFTHSLYDDVRLTRISKSIVWFDGNPGLLLDYELSIGKGGLELITRDNDYEYRNIIVYPVDGTYTKEQLKDIILDFKFLEPNRRNNETVHIFKKSE